jgi:nucleoside-diphosphate-sugar epimerase
LGVEVTSFFLFNVCRTILKLPLSLTKSIFITGGTGLVGSHIIRKFIQEGKKIKALKRPDSSTDVLADINHLIEWVDGDILDILFLKDVIEGCEAVIHAAAIVSFHPKLKDEMYLTNVEGTANLVNISLYHKISRFCFISSVASLGRGEHQLIDEKAKWEDSHYNTEYAKTKHAAEQEVWRGIAEGLDAFIVNPSFVLGTGDLNRSSNKIFQFVLQGKKFFPAGSINYIDARDIAEVIFRLIYSEISEERFILSAGNVSYEQLFGKIAEKLNLKKPNILVNTFWLNILWRIERIRSFLTGSSPLISRETALIAGKNYIYDNKKIKEKLDFNFHSLDETLDWVCAEIRNKIVIK